MINKIKHSISCVLIFSISNLPLIGTTFASETKSLKADSAKLNTPIFLSNIDGLETLTVNSGSIFVRSDLLFQNQKYRNTNEKHSQFIISQNRIKTVINLGGELSSLFKKIDPNNKQEIYRSLSKNPRPLSSFESKKIRKVISTQKGYNIVGYGTIVTLPSGVMFVCIKTQCLVKE